MQPGGGGRRLGRVYVSVHADTDPFAREVERGVRTAAADADNDLGDVGEQWGDTIGDAVSGSLRGQGGDFAGAIEDGIRRERINIDGDWFTIDRRGNLHNSAGRFAGRFIDEIEEAFERAGSPGGPINRIGTGIADAIGAGFNVSGRSPLVAALIPAFGALIGVVLAAVQAVNGLFAVLVTLPTIIAGIALQVGVLMLAFKGVGTAVQGAFAAKNAKELQEAIKGLTPPAQAFVKSLLPLKPLFKEIQRVTQSNFFKALGTPIPGLVEIFGPTFITGFARLATVMGGFFRDLATFFASPTFVAFVKDVFPATARWVATFGPAFINFLSVLISMADLAIPFLNRLGLFVSNNLDMFTRILRDLVRSGDFNEWLNDMFVTLQSVAALLVNVTGFIATFMAQLNTAGGVRLIDALGDAFKELSFFFSTPVGQKALEGLINAGIYSIQIITGLIIIVGSLFALLEVVGEALVAFFSWLLSDGLPAIADFYTGWLDIQIAIIQAILIGLAVIGGAIVAFFVNMYHNTVNWLQRAVNWVAGLPGRFRAALGDIGSFLVNAGRALIQGFINGMRSMFGNLGQAAKDAMGFVGKFLPGSPAKEGPLSGQGYSLLRGERMMQDFGKGLEKGADGITSALGSDLGAMVDMIGSNTTNNTGIAFGPGAVKVSFEGTVPTEEEARRTGAAVGAGINDQLARRNTRLAVRTL